MVFRCRTTTTLTTSFFLTFLRGSADWTEATTTSPIWAWRRRVAPKTRKQRTDLAPLLSATFNMERSWIMLSDYLPALFAGERPGLLDDHLVPFFGGVLFVVRLEFPGHLVVLQILGVFLERSHGNHAGLRHLVGNHGSHEPALVVLRLFDLGHVLFGCASLPWFRKVRIRAIFLRISRNSAISLTLPGARSNFKPRSFSRSSRSIFRSSASGLFFISWICCFFMLAGDHLGLHGQFERGQAQRFLGDPLVGGFHFEDYPAGTHHEHVMVHAAFAAAHGRFRRPLGDGLVREHADPKASLPFDVVRDGPPGGFDLPRVQSRALERLQAVLAVIQVQPAGFHGPLAISPFVPFPVFYFLRNQHVLVLPCVPTHITYT